MLVRHYPVLIAGKRYSPEFQTDRAWAAKWKQALERAYGTFASCQCPSQGERKLAIKHREASDDFHLARFAGTGAEHANECRFYAPAPERSGMQGYARGVVEEGEDGVLRVRLARGLRVQPAEGKHEGRAAAEPRAPGIGKSAMSLLGLLHLLWTEARLTTWYPAMDGKRSSSRVHYWLRQTAERIAANRLKLSDVLLTAAGKDSPDAARNQAIAQTAAQRGYRLVAIAPLARYSAQAHGGDLSRLPLAGPFGMPFLNLAPALWASAQQRFGSEVAAWKRGARVMAIAQLTLRPGNAGAQAEVMDLALMQVSERWIPLDSDYEGVLEARLHAAGRSFDKPLRFDADEGPFFPDFWLLDVDRDYPLEVFGMATPEYLTHKALKSAWYTERYGAEGWWCWDAAADPGAVAMPGFPDKASRS